MENLEIRSMESSFEVEVEENNYHIKGYANRYDDMSKIMVRKDNHTGTIRKFSERMENGVFQRAIMASGYDTTLPDDSIQLLLEHNDKDILASTTNGSLRVSDDGVGLWIDANIIPTTYGKDTYTLIKQGVRCHMSVGMYVLDDEWIAPPMGHDVWVRVIKEIRLFEISVVRNPAYANTELEARGYTTIQDDILKEEGVEKRMNPNDEILLKVLEQVDRIATGFDLLGRKFEAFTQSQDNVNQMNELKEINASLQADLDKLGTAQVDTQVAINEAEKPAVPEAITDEKPVEEKAKEEVPTEDEEVVKEDEEVVEEKPVEDEVPKSSNDKEEEVPAEDESPEAPVKDEAKEDEEEEKKKKEQRSLDITEMARLQAEMLTLL